VGGAWATLDNKHPVTDDFFVAGTTVSLSPANVVEGVHIGWQQQWGGIVAGVELGGFYYNDMDDRALSVTSPPCSFAALGSGRPCGIEDRVEWSFQVVGRLGVAVGHVLPYVKGGWTVVDINTLQVACCVPSGTVTSTFNSPLTFSRADKLHNGWVVGGGLEWALKKDVILGVDYQHTFLDDATHSSPCFLADALGGCSPAPGTLNRTGSVRLNGDIDQVTARLSFKFDRETAAAAPLK
jgi:opacity protein-like surface antigen